MHPISRHPEPELPRLGRVVARAPDGLVIDTVPGPHGGPVFRAWHHGEILHEWDDRAQAAWFLHQWLEREA